MKVIKSSTVGKILLLFVSIAGLVGSIDAMKPNKFTYTVKSKSRQQAMPKRQIGLESVWVQTFDGQKVEMPKWQIDQMKALQVLFVYQKGKNSEGNPVDALMINYEDLTLMQKALTIAGNLGEFAVFCENLMPEQKAHLINAAFAVEAIGLASLLAEGNFSPEIQEKLGATVPGILEPVVGYLQNPEHSKIVLKGENDRSSQFPRCALFSPNGDYILSGGQTFLGLWDGKTGKKVKIPERNYGNVSCIAFSFDGKFIIAGSSTEKNNLILLNISDLNNITYTLLEGHIDWVKCIAFSPDGTKIVSGGVRGQVILWDISNVHKISHTELVGHMPYNSHLKNFVREVAFSSDGNYIISCSDGVKNNLILWDGKTGEQIRILEGHGLTSNPLFSGVSCAAFSSDGNYIISGSKGIENNLILWDGRTGDKIKILEGHKGDVFCAAFSPNSNYIISGSSGIQNNLLLWDISPIVTKNKLPYLLFSLKNYVSGALPQEIVKLIGQNLVELSQLNIVSQEFKGHGTDRSGYDGTMCVAFSPDAKYIVSGGWGKQNLIVWNAKTGKQVKAENLGSAICDVAFGPDSRSIVCTGGYGNHYLVLFKLLDTQALGFISTKLNIAQARFLYRLYLATLNKIPVMIDENDLDYGIYKSLPKDVQNLINSIFPFQLASKTFAQAVEEKKNSYKSFFAKSELTVGQKIKNIKQAMASEIDKNSVAYKACQELLNEFEIEAAFEEV